jgi:hypothetical protein
MTGETADLPPEGMELAGVALAGSSEEGATTWGLNLVFTAAGITVVHPQSHAESLVAWSGLDATRCAERRVLPDGRSATVLELISDGQSLRFLLPADTVAPGQVAYLDQALPAWLARYKGSPVVIPASVTPAPTAPPAIATATVAVARDRVPPDAQSPVSVPPDGRDGAGDPESGEEQGLRPAGPGRRTRLLLVGLLVAVVIAAAVYVVSTPGTSGPSASALAASINVRARDLPAGWVPTTAAGSTPPAALPSARSKAAQALAACISQPSAVVEGWFGTTAFPGQMAAVTSRTFQGGSAPTVQIVSTTKVMHSSAQVRSLADPFATQNFATCFEQYQVAAVAVPITAQVQSVVRSAPAGVKVSYVVTTFTLSNQQTEVVEDAFLVGGRAATVLQWSAAGLSVPSADVTSASDAVARRMAEADRS